MVYNSETKLQQALNVVIKEFEKYKINLLCKSMLVIYRDRNTKQLDYIIIKFAGSNYYHLTGLAYKEDNSDNTKEEHFGSRFYKDLEDKKLSISNLKIKDNNTELKIKALPFVTSQYRYSNMTGDFNESGIKLQLDKVIGNVSTCLGLKQIGFKTFAPASSIYDDTRKFAKIAHQVVAIFIKETSDASQFETIKYVAKGHNLENLTYSAELKDLFSLEEYRKQKA